MATATARLMAPVPSGESLAAWLHLIRAGLLANVDAVAAGGTAKSPATPVGGVYNILSEEVHGTTRLWLRLGNPTGGAGSANTNGLFSPDDAAKIDSRLDDGDPTHGRVRTRDMECVAGTTYAVGTNATCTLSVSLS